MSGSEEEPDPAFVDAGGDLGGHKLHLGAERRQHVGAAAFRRGGAIAVLGDPGAGCRGHERRGGGDVEGVRAVASGAASVDEPIEPHFHPHGARPHRLCRARDLVGRLALHAQRDEKRGHLRGGRGSREHRLDGGARFLAAQAPPFHHRLDRLE